MITMPATYAGDEQTPFDRDHWINVHFPLVRRRYRHRPQAAAQRRKTALSSSLLRVDQAGC